MKKRISLFTLATILLFTSLFSVGAFTATSNPQNVVIASTKSVDISRYGKKNRSIILGKKFELEVNKPDAIRDKNLTWTISNPKIVGFAGKERHDDDIKFKALKVGSTSITCKNEKTGKKVSFKITVKNKPKVTNLLKSKQASITAKGSVKRSVKVNREIELEVKKAKGIKDKNLKWEIKDSSILAFEDPEDGIYDDDMEFIGKKAGSTKVTCTNKTNKDIVTFTVTVK